jgi:hypothetical protein
MRGTMKKTSVFLIVLLISISACTDNENSKKRNALMTAIVAATGNQLPGSNGDKKLVFIHHSTGSAWIATGNGNLGSALNADGYYVTECDYGWDAQFGDNLGDRTDTGNWPEWFTNIKMPYVYGNSSHFDYDDVIDDPGGQNEIIMFKSCFPNSEVGSSIDDEKAIYNSLLPYFGVHLDKMFVLIVPPPEIVIDSAALTRELANWLVASDGWLNGYTGNNVYVFDYYNVLTHPDNHHRYTGAVVEHIVANSSNELYYYTGTDSHPTAEGHQKATAEFVPLLNYYYNTWKGL